MKKLEKYFTQQYDLALKNFKLAQVVLSEKPLHELRVSIKRIKALLDFLVQLLPNKPEIIQHFEPFRKIFRVAGKLRDIHVQEKLLLKCAKEWSLPIPLAYHNYLREQQKIAFQTFKKTAQKVKLEDIATNNKPLKKILHKVSLETIHENTEKLLRYRFMSVRNLVQENDDESLHEARKIIKSIYYILHLVFTPATPQQYQDLKILEEHIGEWHDLAVLYDSMQTALNSPEEAVQSFLARLMAEKISLQQKIPTLVHRELRCWKIFGKLKLKY